MKQTLFHQNQLDSFLVRSLNRQLNTEELQALVDYIQNDKDFRRELTTWVSLLREFDWPQMKLENIGEIVK